MQSYLRRTHKRTMQSNTVKEGPLASLQRSNSRKPQSHGYETIFPRKSNIRSKNPHLGRTARRTPPHLRTKKQPSKRNRKPRAPHQNPHRREMEIPVARALTMPARRARKSSKTSSGGRGWGQTESQGSIARRSAAPKSLVRSGGGEEYRAEAVAAAAVPARWGGCGRRGLGGIYYFFLDYRQPFPANGPDR
jgi:hypothetical protein